ncbi:hypothetical protein [uncultured Alistipes sp.]|uniref:hypothetical protein n=1 Tax=uncultured Alistipes sp. TaxID=538949 RepID=UPI002605C895|nr:hypothetical protein [uncultured Alistipes sp.]
MTKLVIPILLAYCCMSCGDHVEKMQMPAYTFESNGPTVYTDSYITYIIYTPVKCDAAQLSLIAADIRKNTDVKYTSLWIEYREPQHYDSYATSSIDATAAVTKIKPQEESLPEKPQPAAETVREPEPVHKQAAATPQKERTIDGTVIGRFRDNMSNIYVLYSKNGKYYIDNSYTDGSHMTQELETRTRNGAKTYNVVGDPYEYFVIEGGRLYCYDEDGNLGGIYDPA